MNTTSYKIPLYILTAFFALLVSVVTNNAYAAPTSSLIAKHSGKCADVSGASTANGVKLIQFVCHSNPNQQFSFEPVGDAFQIKALHSQKCIGIPNASTVAGTDFEQMDCSTQPHMLYKQFNVGDAYHLRVQHSNMCFHVHGGSARITQWPCDNASSELNLRWDINIRNNSGENWAGPYPIPLVAASAANLPDGRILTWSAYAKMSFGGSFGQTYTSIFNPETNTGDEGFVSNTNHDMFCPGTALLDDGRIMVTGGSNSGATSIYELENNAWVTGDAMNTPRGYHVMTPLSDGSVLVMGGSWSGGQGNKNAEVWSQDEGWKAKSGILATTLSTQDVGGESRADNHMWLFEAPNGEVFHAGPSKQMHWLNLDSTNGSTTNASLRGDDNDAMNGNAVMYDIGKILTIGGAPQYSNSNATNRAYDIDINNGEGNVVVNRVQNMTHRRAYHNSVVLPSGEVIVIGGQAVPIPFSDSQSVFTAELWNPTTKTFTELNDMQVPRNYHSVSLLMKDGRVFVSGGGLCGNCATNHADVEILTPPYLLNSDGSDAIRPVINASPTNGFIGDNIKVSMGESGAYTFALMRLGAATHSINNDQRRIPLTIVNQNATEFTLKLNSNPSILIPGNYFLFAMNDKGVPSIAETINIGINDSVTEEVTLTINENENSDLLLNWSSNGNTTVNQYWLEIGSTLGSDDIYGKNLGLSTSQTVNNLPTDGRTLFIRLYYNNTNWDFVDLTYELGNGNNSPTTVINSPENESILTGSDIRFSWSSNGNADVNQYWLEIGTSIGASDLFGKNLGLATSVEVTGLPTDGSTVYARLYYNNTNWDFVDFTYTSGSTENTALPRITVPASGSTLTDSSATFNWTSNGSTNVNQYWLEVGTSLGGSDIFGKNLGLSRSQLVTNLPTDGSTVYARLYYNSTNWDFVDFSYSTANDLLNTAERVINDTSAPVGDTTAPSITILGGDIVTHIKGKTYTDAGATAFDKVDGDVPVTTIGEVNVNVVGSYIISYRATDSAGHSSLMKRTVNVVKNNTISSNENSAGGGAIGLYFISLLISVVGTRRYKLNIK